MAQIFDNITEVSQNAFDRAFAQGTAYTQNLRKNLAFNALQRTYGDIVGDIDLATKAQAYGQAEKMNPLLVENQQLTNTGLGQLNEFNALNNPLKLEAGRLANETSQFNLDSSQRIQKARDAHGALSGALATLGQQLDGVTDPDQRLAIFDQQVANLAPLLGADPVQLAHQLAPYRAAVAAQGTAALPDIQAQLDAAMEAQLSPQDRLNLEKAGIGLDIEKTKLEQEREKAARGGLTPAQVEKQKREQRAEAAAFVDYDQSVGDITGEGGTIDMAIQYINDHPDAVGFLAGGVLGKGAKDIAGTPAYNLAKLLDPITSNILINKLMDMKSASATGASGFGQLSEKEGEQLRATIASLDQGQSKDLVLKALEKVRTVMNRGRENLRKRYSTYYGSDPSADVGGDAQDSGGDAVDWTTFFGGQ